jgi:hypothetical protein
MKLLTIACFLLAGVAQAQTSSDSLYIVTYTTGPSWDFSKKPNEQPYFNEHSVFLGKLMKDGTAKLGARFADKGMMVIQATSLAAARELITSDAAVVNQLFKVDVQKFNVFFYGCIEKPK